MFFSMGFQAVISQFSHALLLLLLLQQLFEIHSRMMPDAQNFDGSN